MRSEVLKVGDVVEMKEGMAVEYEHFENVYYPAGRMDGTSQTIVYIGKIYEGRGNQWAARLRLRNAIKEAFDSEGLPVEEDILRRFLAHQVKDTEPPKQFVIPPGLYQVAKIGTEGIARIIYCKPYKVAAGQPLINFIFFQDSPSKGGMNHDKIQVVE